MNRIPTNAGIPGFHQFVMRWTSADVFALRVDAGAILAGLWALTFVYISAVATGTIELVALVTFTTEHAKDVLAATKDTEITEHLTLVDVYASLLITLVRVHEAHLALATISTRIIQAVTIFTEGAILCALIDVLAVVAVASKTSITHALQNSFSEMS